MARCRLWEGREDAELGMSRSRRTMCALFESLDLPYRQWGTLRVLSKEAPQLYLSLIKVIWLPWY